MFTTHTPEEAGNEKHDIHLCHKMSYFCGLTIDEVRKLTGNPDEMFNHSLAAFVLQDCQWRFTIAWKSIKSNVEQVRWYL